MKVTARDRVRAPLLVGLGYAIIAESKHLPFPFEIFFILFRVCYKILEIIGEILIGKEGVSVDEASRWSVFFIPWQLSSDNRYNTCMIYMIQLCSRMIPTTNHTCSKCGRSRMSTNFTAG